MEKIPYVLVVGEKEQTNGTVNVRHREKGAVGELKHDLLLKQFSSEVAKKS